VYVQAPSLNKYVVQKQTSLQYNFTTLKFQWIILIPRVYLCRREYPLSVHSWYKADKIFFLLYDKKTDQASTGSKQTRAACFPQNFRDRLAVQFRDGTELQSQPVDKS